MGGTVEKKLTKKQEQKKAERELTTADFSKGVYGKRAEEPILGSFFSLPKRKTHFPNFILDTSFPYVKTISIVIFFYANQLILQIPVYQHLIRPPPASFAAPKSPLELGTVQHILDEEEKMLSEAASELSICKLPDYNAKTS